MRKPNLYCTVTHYRLQRYKNNCIFKLKHVAKNYKRNEKCMLKSYVTNETLINVLCTKYK